MRVLFAYSGAESERLVAEASDAGHPVTHCDPLSQQLAGVIRREIFDIVVVLADPEALTTDVVDACDSRGVLLVAIVDSREHKTNAIACGVDEVASPWQSWDEIVTIAVASDPSRKEVGLLEHTQTRRSPLRILPDRHSPDRAVEQFSNDSESFGNRSSSFHSVESRDARVVTVWGPTGAPGRTTVALNLAAVAADRGSRTIVIDADTYGGAIAVRCGLFDEAPGIARACRLAGAGTLTTEELTSLAHEVRIGSRSFHVVTGILTASRWPEISRDRLEKVIERARESYDTVILDVGFSLETDEEVSSDMLAPRRNGATLAAIRASTDIVAVSGADSVGLARFIRSWSDLAEVNNHARMTAVVNRVVARREGASTQDNIASTFSRFAGIRDVVLITDDVDLATRADVRGVPAVAIDSQSRFAASINQIAQRSLGLQAQASRPGMRERLRGIRLLG